MGGARDLFVARWSHSPDQEYESAASGRQSVQILVEVPTSVGPNRGVRSGSRAAPVMPDFRGPKSHTVRLVKAIWYDRHPTFVPQVES